MPKRNVNKVVKYLIFMLKLKGYELPFVVGTVRTGSKNLANEK